MIKPFLVIETTERRITQPLPRIMNLENVKDAYNAANNDYMITGEPHKAYIAFLEPVTEDLANIFGAEKSS